MGRTPSARRFAVNPRAVAAAVLGAGFLAMLALNLPGQLSYDSIAQLHDGRTGTYNAWHPPVMAFLLGLADAAMPGTTLFVICVGALLFGALISILWLERESSWRGTVVAALLVCLPQFLIYQGTVWKDVLFADSAVAGFVCLAHAAVHWHRPRLRYALLAAGIGLLVLATLARQNGAIVLVFGIFAVALQAARNSKAGRVRAFAGYGITLALAASAVLGLATLALASRVPGESGAAAQFKLLEDYDLIGALKESPSLKLDVVARANPDLAELMRTDGVRLYTPERNDTLAQSQDLQNELVDTPNQVLASQWRALVRDEPWTYLKVRARVFWWTFATPSLARCFPFFVGVQGPPRYMRDLGLSVRTRTQDILLTQYGALFVGTPVFSHLAYAVLALAVLIVLLRRRRPADLVMVFLLLSALAFTASFFVISIACDYRYLAFLDLSALASAFHLAAARPKSAGMQRSIPGRSGATSRND